MRFCATPEDIELITGRKRAKQQRDFLLERKIKFRVDADGHPIVPLVELERYFGLDSLPRKPKIDVSSIYEKAPIRKHAKG